MARRLARGFTLVELVMVILLLGIMATFSSPVSYTHLTLPTSDLV